MSDIKVVFVDLDSTIIETRSGKTFPTCVLDFKPIWKVWKYIKQLNLTPDDYVFIVTNQGGIDFEDAYRKYLFTSKIACICAALNEYLDLIVDYRVCFKNDPDEALRRKPSPGMLSELINDYGLGDVPKSSILMIGDASGKPGDFSDSDLMAAVNFGIKYLDVDDI